MEKKITTLGNKIQGPSGDEKRDENPLFGTFWTPVLSGFRWLKVASSGLKLLKRGLKSGLKWLKSGSEWPKVGFFSVPENLGVQICICKLK